MKKLVFGCLAVMLVLVYGCKKEESFELGNNPSAGSLQSDLGDCLPSTVNGTYIAGTALVPATNTITVSVDVATTGTYLIETDTINGYYFRGTGTFTTLGVNTVTLRSDGTPFTDGIDNFVVSYNGTTCSIAVEVLPTGTGDPAVFTLVNGGTPPNCATAVVSGAYSTSTTLNATHYVDITVNVTQIGTYAISATGGGMTFSKTGAFTTTGNQVIRLNGSGTAPAAAGAVQIDFTSPSTPACSFTVTVAAQAVYTVDCSNVSVGGTYQVGVPLNPGVNRMNIPITAVTTPGPFSMTVSINGMLFSSGSFNLVAPTTVVLEGTGTPTAAAAPVSSTTLPAPHLCPISINVAAAGGPATFSLNCAGATVQGTYTAGVALTGANTITIPVASITTPGTYSITTTVVNGMVFSGTGNLTTMPASIILTGSGTPTAAAAPSNIVLPAPFETCTVPVTVVSAPVIEWSFQIGSTTYSGATSDVIGIDNTSFPPFNIVDYYGEYAGNADMFNLTIGDPSAPIFNATEVYNTNFTTLVNGAYFYFDGLPAIELEATDPGTTPGVNIVVTITSHNTATKTIIGTFSGSAFDYVSNTNKTITNGTFKIVYPN